MPERDTVTDEPDAKVRPEMSLVGYIVAFGSAIVLLPVLPFLAAARLVNAIHSKDPHDVETEIDYDRSAAEPPRNAA